MLVCYFCRSFFWLYLKVMVSFFEISFYSAVKDRFIAVGYKKMWSVDVDDLGSNPFFFFLKGAGGSHDHLVRSKQRPLFLEVGTLRFVRFRKYSGTRRHANGPRSSVRETSEPVGARQARSRPSFFLLYLLLASSLLQFLFFL